MSTALGAAGELAIRSLIERAPLASSLAAAFKAQGFTLALVGGPVRDAILGRLGNDLDFTTNAPPQESKKILSTWAEHIWETGIEFGTVAGKRGDTTVEVTTYRSETYDPQSRKPEVQYGKDINGDLSRRDFTVNAMALELTSEKPEFIDPFNGLIDLSKKLLRTPSSAEQSFSDDPLRMMRAARFASQLDFEIAPDVLVAMKSMTDRISIISAERVRNELDRLMVTDHPSLGLWFLVDTGLAEHFFPELPAMKLEQDPIHRHKDVLTHTFAVVENVRRDAAPQFDFRITRLAALFHDIGKPKTRAFADGKGVTFHHHEVVGARMAKKRLLAMRYSTQDVEAITELVALHLRFHTYQMGWSDSAVRRYVRDAGPLLTELNVLTRCDCTTRNEKKALMLSKRMDELEERIAELAKSEELAALRPEMDGAQVMEHLSLSPGRQVGAALNFLMDIRLDEGELGAEEIRNRLDVWWAAQQK